MAAADAQQQQRVNELVTKAQALADAANIRDALKTLQEALALAPESQDVKKALALLQQDAELDTPLELVARYIRDGDADTGKAACNAVATTDLSPEDSRKTLDVALAGGSNLSLKDQIIGLLFAKPNSRKALTEEIHGRPTEIFQALWASGEEAIKGLVNTILSPTAWVSEEDRTTTEKDVFMLLMAKVLEPALDNEELAMRAVARLLAADAKGLKDLVEPESFDVVLSFLSIEKPVGLRSQSTLATAKFLEASPEQGQRVLTEFVVSRLGKQNVDDLITAFSAASAIFPIVPEMASKLFLTEGFIEDLVRIGQGKKSMTLRRSVLELLSAACVEKKSRESIKENCEGWLQDLVVGDDSDLSTLAALVLAKIASGTESSEKGQSSSSSMNDGLVDVFRKMVLEKRPDSNESAIEGLAYRSTDPKVKEELANDSVFLKSLLSILSSVETAGPLVFGGLTIISNLTKYPPVMSSEQKRIAQLKAYANQSKPASVDPEKEDARITARCSKVLDAGVGSVLVKFARTGTPTLLALIASIIVCLVKHPRHRGRAAQQGLFDVALRLVDAEPVAQNLPQVKRDAALALAQILIQINPALLITSASGNRSVATVLRALDWLLTPADLGENDAMGRTVNYFPVAESLRAMTNMAAMVTQVGDDLAIRIILAQSWDTIEASMESDIAQVRRAATECLCNLCISDDTIKLFTEGPKGEDRMAILLRQGLFDEDRGTRLAAGGALATILTAEGGVANFVKIKGSLELLGKLAALTMDEWTVEKQTLELARVLSILETVMSDEEHGEVATKQLSAWCRSKDGADLKEELVSRLGSSPLASQAQQCAALLG